MRLVRCAAIVAAATAVALASAATAAPKAPGPAALTFTDAKGDAATGAAYDITSVSYTTSGVTTKTGKGKSKGNIVYTPKALVVSMTLAGPPAEVPGTLYELDAETSQCGQLALYFTPGVDGGSGGYVSCGSEPDDIGSTATTLDVVPVVSGNTVTFTIPFSAAPKEMGPGTAISEFTAYSTQADPATAIVGPYMVSSAFNFDNAASDASYRIG